VGLASTYTIHLRFIGKRVVDFLIVLIELFSLAVTAEAGATSEYRVGAVARSFATAKRLTPVNECLTSFCSRWSQNMEQLACRPTTPTKPSATQVVTYNFVADGFHTKK